ncbi:MAG: PilW family protein [Candidatus Eisenbacteria bacterium]
MRVARGARGYTILELMLACFLALIVVLALGAIILQSQRSWRWTRDKTMLQANTTEAVEWVERRVRGAWGITMLAGSPPYNSFEVYDQHKTVKYKFDVAQVNGSPRLRENLKTLVDRRCNRFLVTPNADRTSVRIELELEDNSGNRVAAVTQCAVRNRHFIF